MSVTLRGWVIDLLYRLAIFLVLLITSPYVIADVYDDYAGYCQRSDGTVYATFYKNNCFSNKNISFNVYAKIKNTSLSSAEKKLARLKRFLDKGLITQEEYDKKRRETLGLEDSVIQEPVIASKDTTGPKIIVAKSIQANRDMVANVRGRVEDDSKIVSLTIDGDQVSFPQGRFNQPLYVLPNGQDVEIVATDKFGNQTKKTITLRRTAAQIQTVSFDKLNPLAIKAPLNNNAVALIIGVEDYENTFTAMFANKDAQLFNDFAHQAFGVPQYNIKLLTNTNARRNNTLKTIATWLPKVIKEHKTDFYLFFSGHGLASSDGKDLYLLPYDGYPEILEESSLLRNKIFESIANLNPRTVTVFLDTCYSGATRSEEMLLAAKPIFIESEAQEIPLNFTVFSASSSREIANVLKEAEHGLFSYFLMKGLEGDADTNHDEQITNGELIAFINKNVSRQASQTPQLAGDANRILVEW
jgi:hypothetical protein